MALASQTARSHTMPRSSEAFRRRSSGSRNKRVVGVLLLAGVCVAMTLWAMRARDGGGRSGETASGAGAGSAAAANSGKNTPISNGETVPAATTLLNADPHGASSPANSPLQRPGTLPQNPPPAAAQQQPATAPAMDVREPLSTPPAGTSNGQGDAALPPPQVGVYAAITAAADRAMQQQRPVEARTILNRALMDPTVTSSERSNIRARMAELNQTLLFGPAQTPGDPLTETYKVVKGDNLIVINRKLGLVTEPSLIARLNRMSNPNALQIGQTLKVARGPFHAVVSKSAFRMDIYAGPTPGPSSIGTSGLPEGAEPGWTYIRSFPVGLGAQGLTPVGSFAVKEGSKLVNPHWANPRTGEKFDANDPKNPIGERWMGLDGIDEASRAFTGYGVHGTIDPASIGHEMSMGCVRLNAADIEVVYELLMGRVSVVKIVP